MKLCVFGAGAVGGALAVRLRQSGQDVSIIARGAHAKAIQERGLTLISGDSRHTVHLPCVSAPEHLADLPDVVLVTVKQTQLPAIAKDLARLTRAGAWLVLIANGIPWWFARELPLPAASAVLEAIDPRGTLHATIDRQRLAFAVVQSSNEIVEPGVVLSTTPERNRLILSPVVPAGSGPVMTALCEVLRSAHYEALEVPDIRPEIWKKMAFWMAVSPMAALTGLSLDRLIADPKSFALMCSVMREMLAIGQRLGLNLPDDAEERIGFFRDKPTRPSLLQDFELGREPELASCALIFDEVATSLGVAAPHIHLLTSL